MATKNKVYQQLPHRLWMKVSLAILVLYLSNMYTMNCQYIRVATEMAKANRLKLIYFQISNFQVPNFNHLILISHYSIQDEEDQDFRFLAAKIWP